MQANSNEKRFCKTPISGYPGKPDEFVYHITETELNEQLSKLRSELYNESVGVLGEDMIDYEKAYNIFCYYIIDYLKL